MIPYEMWSCAILLGCELLGWIQDFHIFRAESQKSTGPNGDFEFKTQCF